MVRHIEVVLNRPWMAANSITYLLTELETVRGSLYFVNMLWFRVKVVLKARFRLHEAVALSTFEITPISSPDIVR